MVDELMTNLTDTRKDIFGNTPVTVLRGATGLVLPDTPTQNKLFADVAKMGLSAEDEGAYAEAARAVASAKDSIDSKPVIQSSNSIRVNMRSIFDSIKI